MLTTTPEALIPDKVRHANNYGTIIEYCPDLSVSDAGVFDSLNNINSSNKPTLKQMNNG